MVMLKIVILKIFQSFLHFILHLISNRFGINVLVYSEILNIIFFFHLTFLPAIWLPHSQFLDAIE